jgi:hypothetical protein
MAYILRQKGLATNVPCHYFECDEDSDLPSIDVKASPMGSRCYVINSGKTYALNSAKQWKLVPTGGSGGGGGDTPDDNKDIIYDGGEEV